MTAILISTLLLCQTPAAPAKAEARPEAKKAPNTRWADGTGTVGTGLTLGSPDVLLEWPQVRKEIGLTDKQYDEVVRAVNVAEKQWHVELTQLLETGKLHIFQDSNVIIAGRHAADQRAMATVMTPGQIRRLKEIYLQAKGLRALANNLEFQKIFNLSESQYTNIRMAYAQYLSEGAKLSRATSALENAYKRSLGHSPTAEEERTFRIENANVFDKNQDRRRELEATLLREINRQLTKRQRTAFEKAKGKPFDFEGMTAPGSLERNEQKETERKAKEKAVDPPDKAAAR